MMRDGREPARIQRALDNTRALYANCPYPRLDTTRLTPGQAAQRLLELLALP